ncbi:MAG: LysR family transcriptional regulator [Clostridia bacterium]|nr:LysR family transcriptional regulator [Clostridia bacterium]
MFHKYDYVLAVYEEKSFTKAAAKLFISQPTLSVAIKNIEAQLGAPLFERTGSQIVPTDVGREYLAAAQRIQQIEREFSHKLGDIYGLETGSLTVGGSNYLSCYVLPKIITRFSADHPKIAVTPVEGTSLTLAKMIENEELDLVVDSFEGVAEQYECTPLLSERVLLCVPAEAPINKGLEKFCILPEQIQNGSINLDEVPSLSITHFAKENFILLKSGHNMHHRAMRAFERAGITPNVLFFVDQLNISYAICESGMGPCFVTDTFIHYSRPHENVRLYKISEEPNRRTLYIAYKKNRYCSIAMREFIRTAQNIVGQENNLPQKEILL